MTVKHVRFLEDAVVRDHAGAVIASFKAGKTYDLSSESAQRWVRRGKAKIASVASPVSASIQDTLIEEEVPADLNQEPEAGEAEPAQSSRRRTAKR